MTTETTNEVTEVTQQTVKEVSRFAQYIQDNIPTLIGFGIRVLLALVFLSLIHIYRERDIVFGDRRGEIF